MARLELHMNVMHSRSKLFENCFRETSTTARVMDCPAFAYQPKNAHKVQHKNKSSSLYLTNYGATAITIFHSNSQS